MIKKVLTSMVAVLALSSISVKADFLVTNMRINNNSFDLTLTANGALLTTGGGSVSSNDLFLNETWSATQETLFMTNGNQWAGTTGNSGIVDESYDYNDELAAIGVDQIAVGLLFNWNYTTTAVLAVFDCTEVITFDIVDPYGSCTAASSVVLDNGPFVGSSISFNAVPLPASVWLLGSGLLGFVGASRFRRKAAGTS